MSARELTTEHFHQVDGPVTAVTQVLDGMRSLGHGTTLFVNGGSAARFNHSVAGTSVAFAAGSAYAGMLHDTLAPDGTHVGQLIVPGAITPATRPTTWESSPTPSGACIRTGATSACTPTPW